MKNRLSGWCCYIASISAIVIILITSIDLHCFNSDFYESEYASLDTANSLEMSQTDLMSATTTLLDYLQDKRSDIQVEIEVREMERPAFNERETLHMVDVKNLYQNALFARTIAILCLIASLAYLFYQLRKEAWEYLAKGYTQTAFAFIAIVGFLGMWAAVDFTSLWEGFHRVFFTNDLWLLNPRTDLMINMFPETFFFHMVIRIVVTFLLCFLLPFIASIYYWNRKSHFLQIYRKGKSK